MKKKSLSLFFYRQVAAIRLKKFEISYLENKNRAPIVSNSDLGGVFVGHVFAFENDNSSASRVQKSVARLVRFSFKIEVRLEVDVGDAFRKNKFQKVVLDNELVVEFGSRWNLKIMLFFKNFS